MGVYLPIEKIYVIGFSNCDCNSPTQLTKDIPVVNTVTGTAEVSPTPMVSPNLLSGQEQLTEEELLILL